MNGFDAEALCRFCGVQPEVVRALARAFGQAEAAIAYGRAEKRA